MSEENQDFTQDPTTDSQVPDDIEAAAPPPAEAAPAADAAPAVQAAPAAEPEVVVAEATVPQPPPAPEAPPAPMPQVAPPAAPPAAQYAPPPPPGPPAAPYAPPTSVAPAASTEKNKVVAGVLAILLGWLGIHKFYLGYNKEGLIMLAVSVVLGVLTAGLAVSVGVSSAWSKASCI